MNISNNKFELIFSNFSEDYFANKEADIIFIGENHEDERFQKTYGSLINQLRDPFVLTESTADETEEIADKRQITAIAEPIIISGWENREDENCEINSEKWDTERFEDFRKKEVEVTRSEATDLRDFREILFNYLYPFIFPQGAPSEEEVLESVGSSSEKEEESEGELIKQKDYESEMEIDENNQMEDEQLYVYELSTKLKENLGDHNFIEEIFSKSVIEWIIAKKCDKSLAHDISLELRQKFPLEVSKIFEKIEDLNKSYQWAMQLFVNAKPRLEEKIKNNEDSISELLAGIYNIVDENLEKIEKIKKAQSRIISEFMNKTYSKRQFSLLQNTKKASKEHSCVVVICGLRHLTDLLKNELNPEEKQLQEKFLELCKGKKVVVLTSPEERAYFSFLGFAPDCEQ